MKTNTECTHRKSTCNEPNVPLRSVPARSFFHSQKVARAQHHPLRRSLGRGPNRRQHNREQGQQNESCNSACRGDNNEGRNRVPKGICCRQERAKNGAAMTRTEKKNTASREKKQDNWRGGRSGPDEGDIRCSWQHPWLISSEGRIPV